ncbi:hypothetical protein FKM82_019463 [Ascaphus truei]
MPPPKHSLRPWMAGTPPPTKPPVPRILPPPPKQTLPSSFDSPPTLPSPFFPPHTLQTGNPFSLIPPLPQTPPPHASNSSPSSNLRPPVNSPPTPHARIRAFPPRTRAPHTTSCTSPLSYSHSYARQCTSRYRRISSSPPGRLHPAAHPEPRPSTHSHLSMPAICPRPLLPLPSPFFPARVSHPRTLPFPPSLPRTPPPPPPPSLTLRLFLLLFHRPYYP